MRVAITRPIYWTRTHLWDRICTGDVYIWPDSVKFSRSATNWVDRTVVEASMDDRRDLPVSDLLHQSLFSVRNYFSLADDEIDRIRRTLREVVGTG